MYVAGLRHLKIQQGMAKHPLLYGVWHRYKMSVPRVYNAYRPLWTALEFTGFLGYPNTIGVLCAPHLILMECIVLAVFLAAPRLGNGLRRSIAKGAWQAGKSLAACERILCCLRALESLITKYVPLLFLMGRDVWHLHFLHTGFHIKKFCRCSGSSFGGSIDTKAESSTWMPSHWHC